MSKDYANYDYLAVSVKSDQLNRILQCYRALGWTEVKTEDDRDYYDMKYVRLRRPHKITNKDRLQYLQVRMERAINSLVEISNRAHAKSKAALFTALLFAFAFIGPGLWLVLAYDGLISALGYICFGLAGVIFIAAAITCPVMRRREQKTAKGKIIEKLRLTQSLLEEAALLVPDEPTEEDGLDEPAGGEEVLNG